VNYYGCVTVAPGNEKDLEKKEQRMYKEYGVNI
jgi:hypothetical protein